MEAVGNDLGDVLSVYGSNFSDLSLESSVERDSSTVRVNQLYNKNVRVCSNQNEKEKEFDIAVYQHHVKCNNEESKKALVQSFQNMSMGFLGIVVGAIYFSPGSCFLIYNCSMKVWTGVQQFKEACRLSHTDLDDVTFVTDAESYRENTKEVPPGNNGSILKPWTPLDPMKPLDPSFKPFR